MSLGLEVALWAATGLIVAGLVTLIVLVLVSVRRS